VATAETSRTDNGRRSAGSGLDAVSDLDHFQTARFDHALQIALEKGRTVRRVVRVLNAEKRRFTIRVSRLSRLN
jgi:hypothetical protein